MPSENINVTSRGGVSLSGLLVVATVVLVILKWTGVLSISWWVALAPAIALAVLTVLSLVVFFVVVVILAFIQS